MALCEYFALLLRGGHCAGDLVLFGCQAQSEQRVCGHHGGLDAAVFLPWAILWPTLGGLVGDAGGRVAVDMGGDRFDGHGGAVDGCQHCFDFDERARLKVHAMSPQDTDRDWVIEDTQAWLTQAVIGLGLCPFAHAVHIKHQIKYSVCMSLKESDVLGLLKSAIAHLEQTDPEITQTTLIMAPFCVPEFLDFNALVKAANRVLKLLKVRDEFQLADFHPRYVFAGTQWHDPENLSNRAPYPTLHLLRTRFVEAAIGVHPDIDSIYLRNIAMLQSMGFEAFEELGLRARVLSRKPGADQSENN